MLASIGQNQIKIVCMEYGLPQKVLHHRRHFMAVYGRHNPNTFIRKLPLFLSHGLRNTDGLFFNLLCNIQAVSCTGKIKYHAVSPFIFIADGRYPFFIEAAPYSEIPCLPFPHDLCDRRPYNPPELLPAQQILHP